MLNREAELMDIGRLSILRPDRIQGVVDAERLTESICDREGRASGSPCRDSGIAVDGKRKGRTGGQALIERIALKEAGRTVTTANYYFRHHLEREA